MSLLERQTEIDIASIAISLRDIAVTLEKAFPPADTRPLVDRLAEVTKTMFASLDEQAKSRVRQDSRI